MAWDVFFYQNSRGEKLVKEFIKIQDGPTVAKINHKIDLLKAYGPFLTMPHSKKLSGSLYELRIRGKDEIRILYSFMGDRACLLHGFRKKTPEIPDKEIEIARQRLLTTV